MGVGLGMNMTQVEGCLVGWIHGVAGQTTALATAEVCDATTRLLASGDLRVPHPSFKIYGRSWALFGPIVTLKIFEDNVLVRELLETRGDGRVLVIDGGGSMRCAFVGGDMG
ncbi:putative 4-hydroxy-4-methyl-2-oxoglutarate aldolase 3 [Cinnamomum micranthum f. kanehirae]|uniref:Putative 4-hydroxy-4-methyl-2-oxoglutarate aldolase 3 n=1 Tax=Cinnamomum micranthum f. kanehirae TaxID=337451 RepID=A0A3S3N5T5_9MAGN|nr:putative 4-hydroxy-4-methyl-2-oxoglutarate aldolase 3 [Cinnamomum micranthum f. kanehirae]